MEKSLYKSPLVEDKDDVKQLLAQNSQGHETLLNRMRLDDTCRYFVISYLRREEKFKVEGVEIELSNDRKNKNLLKRVLKNPQPQINDFELEKKL